MEINKNLLAGIKELLKSNPRGMNITEISKEVGMNRLSIAKYLEILTVSGQVDVRKFGMSKVYYLSHRMPISAMLSLSSDFLILLDKDLRILYANDSFLEFVKMGREDILYRSIENYSFPLRFGLPLVPRIRDALDGNGSEDEAYYHENGRESYYNVKLVPTVLDDGSRGVTVFFEDVTSRKNAELALRKSHDDLEAMVKERTRELEAEVERRMRSEEKYRSLVEKVEDGVWEMDENCNFTYMSPRIRDILGYTPEEVVGKPPTIFMRPEERGPFMESVDRMVKVDGSFRLLEWELVHKDGRRVIVEITGTPILDASGAPKGFRGVTRDVTRRKMGTQ